LLYSRILGRGVLYRQIQKKQPDHRIGPQPLLFCSWASTRYLRVRVFFCPIGTLLDAQFHARARRRKYAQSPCFGETDVGPCPCVTTPRDWEKYFGHFLDEAVCLAPASASDCRSPACPRPAWRRSAICAKVRLSHVGFLGHRGPRLRAILRKSDTSLYPSGKRSVDLL